MNTPRAVETAFREVIRRYAADTIPSQWLRCATLPLDATNPGGEEAFPQLLISSSPRRLAADGATWEADVQFSLWSNAEEDPAAHMVAAMLESVEVLLDKLLRADGSEEQGVFEDVAAENAPIVLGGCTPTGGAPLRPEGGIWAATVTATLHFTI